jgi:hypothetical protein
VFNETMPTLVETDLNRYFTQCMRPSSWTGIEIFKCDTAGGVCRWAGHVSRKVAQGTFLDEAELLDESMPWVAKNNEPVTQPTNRVFHINVAILLHPCPPPLNYPLTASL